MDDYYQFVASPATAKAENREEAKTAEDEAVEQLVEKVQSFADYGWGKWGSLYSAVRKQGENIVEVTRKDLSEFATAIKEDTTVISQGLNRFASTAAEVVAPQPDTVSTDKGKQPASESNDGETSADAGDSRQEDTPTPTQSSIRSDQPSAFSSLQSLLQQTMTSLQTTTSAHIPALRATLSSLTDRLNQAHFPDTANFSAASIQLPGGINLQQFQEEVAQGTRFAEQYLMRWGSEVEKALENLVSIEAPPESEDAGRELERPSHERRRGRRYGKTRHATLLHTLQSSRTTYALPILTPETSDKDKEAFDSWKSQFDIEERTDAIAKLLDSVEEVRDVMDELVPVDVSYQDFWLRYYYRLHVLEQEEERRKKIMRGGTSEDVKDEEDSFKWDDDDEEEEQYEKTTAKGKNEVASSHQQLTSPATTSTEPSLLSPPTRSVTDDDESWDPEEAEGKAPLDGPGKKSDESFELVHERKKNADSAKSDESKSTDKARTRKNKGNDDDWSDWE